MVLVVVSAKPVILPRRGSMEKKQSVKSGDDRAPPSSSATTMNKAGRELPSGKGPGQVFARSRMPLKKKHSAEARMISNIVKIGRRSYAALMRLDRENAQQFQVLRAHEDQLYNLDNRLKRVEAVQAQPNLLLNMGPQNQGGFPCSLCKRVYVSKHYLKKTHFPKCRQATEVPNNNTQEEQQPPRLERQFQSAASTNMIGRGVKPGRTPRFRF